MLNLEKRLEVGGTALGLVEDRVHLELNGPGWGVFRVKTYDPDTHNGLARFTVGQRGQGVAYPVLTGLVTDAAREEAGSWRVVVRESAALLELRADFALRHCTPGQVLAGIEGRTGVRFLLPATGKYLATRLPYFYAEGTCRQALEGMGAAWGVARAVWVTLPDGRVYWGDWAAGPFPGAGEGHAVAIDAAFVLERDPAGQSVVLPYLPRLRPGAKVALDFEFLAQRVELAGVTARASWGELP